MEKFKIKVGSPERSEIIQKSLFAGGYKWQSGSKEVDNTECTYLYLNYNHPNTISFSGDTNKEFLSDPATELEFSWIQMPERTITLDGKTITLSEESYQAFKTQFK